MNYSAVLRNSSMVCLLGLFAMASSAQTSDFASSPGNSAQTPPPGVTNSAPTDNLSAAPTGSTVSPKTVTIQVPPGAAVKSNLDEQGNEVRPDDGNRAGIQNEGSGTLGERDNLQRPTTRSAQNTDGTPTRKPAPKLATRPAFSRPDSNTAGSNQPTASQSPANPSASTEQIYQTNPTTAGTEPAAPAPRAKSVVPPRGVTSREQMSAGAPAKAHTQAPVTAEAIGGAIARTATQTPAAQADEMLARKIRQDLLARNPSALRDVQVVTENGTVYLRGQVPTTADKDLVFGIARGHAQDMPVQNQITVHQ